MKKYTKVLIAILIIIFTIVVPSNAFEATEFLVVHSQYIQYPVVSGNMIVWTEAETNYYSIHGHDITTHTNSLIHSRTTRLEDPSFGGNIIAWRDYRGDGADVWAYDLTTQSEMPIATGSGTQYTAAVSEEGDAVIYYDDGEIRRYHIQNGANSLISDTGDDYFPSASGNIVVWTDIRNGNEDIYAYNMITEEEFPISTDLADQKSARISGNYIVWGDYRGVMVYDLTTDTELTIAAGGQPDISGNLVVYSRDGDIYGCDIITEDEFVICAASGLQRDPRISGNHVAWNDYRTHDSDAIYGAIIIPEPTAITVLALGSFVLLKRNKQ